MSTVTAKCLAEAQYLPNANTTVYTTPAATTTIIDKLTITNTDSSSHTITGYIVPSGQAVDPSYEITPGSTISANTASELTEYKNQILATGDFIVLNASAASELVVRISGRQIA